MMGYGREVAIEMEIDAEIAYQQHINRLMKGMWTKKNGEQISIGDMTVNHILNCIRMLQGRHDDISEMWLQRFREELQDRDNLTVCVVALDTAGHIKTCTSCDVEDAQRYAKYYRAIGYHSRVLTYKELEELQRKEDAERCTSII